MKPEIAEQWATELESGRHSQTRGVLRRTKDDSYQNDDREMISLPIGECCLGVLCGISGLANWSHPDGVDLGYSYYLGESGTLPAEVKNWAGMQSVNGRIPSLGEYQTLASMNDDGKTFNEIAALIRQHAAEL